MDTEFVPIPNATIALGDFPKHIVTASDGAFAFQNVPVGTYLLTANAVGYGGSAQRIQIKSDETMETKFILQRLAVTTPRLAVFQHVAYHNVGMQAADSVSAAAGGGGCQSCIWSVNVTEPPRALLFEVFGQHTVHHPLNPDQEYVTIQDNATSEYLRNGFFRLPARLNATSEKIGKTHDLKFRVWCDGSWVCFQERRETWLTLFFNMDIPDGYSAVPK
jgi:hypothetical protein